MTLRSLRQWLRWWWPFGRAAVRRLEAECCTDHLEIAAWSQDADSWGWAVLAMFSVDTGTRRRWGTLDCLLGTPHGAGVASDGWQRPRTEADVIRRFWHMVDWHDDEARARAAYTEARSRMW